MVCYIIPSTAAVVHYLLRKRVPSWSKSKHHLWLTLLLSGGAIFGLVDHLFNGGLFFIGGKPVFDILLGITITLVILVSWAVVVIIDKASVKKTVKAAN